MPPVCTAAASDLGNSVSRGVRHSAPCSHPPPPLSPRCPPAPSYSRPLSTPPKALGLFSRHFLLVPLGIRWPLAIPFPAAEATPGESRGAAFVWVTTVHGHHSPWPCDSPCCFPFGTSHTTVVTLSGRHHSRRSSPTRLLVPPRTHGRPWHLSPSLSPPTAVTSRLFPFT